MFIEKSKQLFKNANNRLQTLREELYDVSALQKAQFCAETRLLPLERVDALLDQRSRFSIGSLAGWSEQGVDGSGVWVFLGCIHGRPVMVVANNVCQRGGVFTPAGVNKINRALEMAYNVSLPVVMLVESAGADLTRQAELFVETGRIYAQLARIGQKGLPIIASVHGVATAGGAYLPGMADTVIMVERADVSLAGAALIEAAMGTGSKNVGGALMHASCSGLADYLVSGDQEAINKVRDLFDQMPQESLPQYALNVTDVTVDHVIPFDFKYRYAPLMLIEWLADQGSVDVFKAHYGTSMCVAFIQLSGFTCGVVANNGPIEPDGANKVSQFLQQCELKRLPVLFLHNTTGFMVGEEVEKQGIIKYGSRWLQVMSNLTVPKIALMVGASFGAGSYAMCARGFDPDFIFAWPNAKMAVMGADQAATVMGVIAAKRRKSSDAIAALKSNISDQYQNESDVLYLAGKLWVDEVILPEETHEVLALCLAILARKSNVQSRSYGTSRV